MKTTKSNLRKRRKNRIRAKISGTATKPRLTIHRSLTGHYAQLIDDNSSKTIIGCRDKKEKGTKIEKATKLGTLIAQKAQEKSITSCVFDRNGYKYTGRVKAFAEAARAAGLNF